MSRIVALVSRDPCDELASYLQDAGFDVRRFRATRTAPRVGSLVWIPEPERAVTSIVASVRSWLGARTALRVIVISRRSARLRTNLRGLRRVHTFPAPIFGWQIVDSLRAPRFALT